MTIASALESYLAARHLAGFRMRNEPSLLRSYVRFAAGRGEIQVRAETAIAWAALGRTPPQRERRLRTVRGLAQHAQAEDRRHEVPAIGHFGPARSRRPVPYIFSPDEIRWLIKQAGLLPPPGSIRSRTYTTLIALLASTGMRVSEALSLRLDDITSDGLIIRQTKFQKSRLVPLHTTAERGVHRYLKARSRLGGDQLFLGAPGRPLRYAIVGWTFAKLVRSIGIKPRPGQPHASLHSLRHTFAVRALEACSVDRDRIGRHMVALSTYLGHAHVYSTYWYLETTPHLMAGIAASMEALARGGRP